jgi:hypothetical protein
LKYDKKDEDVLKYCEELVASFQAILKSAALTNGEASA